MVQAARASLAAFLYHQAKYGAGSRRGAAAVLVRCRDADRLYPLNHRFCLLTARRAYEERLDMAGKERPEYVRQAAYWCERGLALNPHSRDLHLVRTRLLQRESVEQAVRYWEDYVHRHFWDRFNQAVLVHLYIESGSYGKAVSTLSWLKGSRYDEEASQRPSGAWEQEKVKPTLPGPSDTRP